MLVAEVAIFAPLPRPLTYQIPDELLHTLKVGSLVYVFVGRSKKEGLVVGIQELEQPPTYLIKPIVGMIYDVPVTDSLLIELYHWIERYYFASFSDVLEAAIPQAIRKNTAIKLQSLLHAEENEGPDVKKFPKQYEAWCFLRQNPGMLKEEFLKKFSRNVFDALLKKHFLYEVFQRQERQVYAQFLPQVGMTEAVTLTEQQRAVCEIIGQNLEKGTFGVYLLHGVTGSGKTEVYIEMIQKIIHEGGSVLYLLPEVTLTAQTVKKLRQRFPNIPVHVWHSGLSEGERRDTWFQIMDHPGTLVVGARSAVFLPLQNLRLVIVDEEHERTYKQEENPRYHGRDVAVYRAKLAQATCILGSATPSLESYYNASKGKYTLVTLPQRVDHRTLPQVTIVDMCYEKGAVFSKILQDKMVERFERREQVMLFLNRRGFAPTVLCPSCDYVATCPHCSIPLTYHKSRQTLLCHFCGYEIAPTKVCPKCGAPEILYRGLGTQRVEEVVQKIFPQVRLARLDSDILQKKYAFIEVLEQFQKHELDLLIGTQMIAKGLDFPNVTLVGLINADGSLSQQDFRANERTFQLLVQVAGRSGRGDLPGEVVVQTRIPGNETLYFAKNTDYSAFFEKELTEREMFHYPPYRHMIALHISSRNASLAELWSQDFLKKTLQPSRDCFPPQTDIRGPVPSPVEKVQDRYRFVLYFLTPKVSRTVQTLRVLLANCTVPKEIALAWDIDAYDFS
ncbi:MAG: primosomal protein N' [Opitutales bacterium]|nr:primosomal protein N' [Opitutales bacterium]